MQNITVTHEGVTQTERRHRELVRDPDHGVLSEPGLAAVEEGLHTNPNRHLRGRRGSALVGVQSARGDSVEGRFGGEARQESRWRRSSRMSTPPFCGTHRRPRRSAAWVGARDGAERMIYAVVVGELEEVLDLRDDLVFAVARIGDLGRPVRGALVVEAVDRRPERGGSLHMALSETAGVGAVALLEPRRGDPGQSCKVGNSVHAVEVELAGVDAQRRGRCCGVCNRLLQLIRRDAGRREFSPDLGISLDAPVQLVECRQRGLGARHVMVDELAEKGVAGRLLRGVRTLVVVDKRARTGSELRTDHGAQVRVELYGAAHLHRRGCLARRRHPAAADRALGCACLVAEPVDRGVVAGRSSALRTLNQRRAAAVAGAHRRDNSQHLLELRLRGGCIARRAVRWRAEGTDKEIETSLRCGGGRLTESFRSGQHGREQKQADQKFSSELPR